MPDLTVEASQMEIAHRAGDIVEVRYYIESGNYDDFIFKIHDIKELYEYDRVPYIMGICVNCSVGSMSVQLKLHTGVTSPIYAYSQIYDLEAFSTTGWYFGTFSPFPVFHNLVVSMTENIATARFVFTFKKVA